MNIYAFLSLTAAIISFYIGIKVYDRNPKKSQNKIFMLFCISVSILSFSEFGMRQSESFSIAKSWFILTGIFPLCGFFLFYFTLVFYNEDINKKLKWLSPLIYSLIIIFVFLSIINSIYYDNPINLIGFFGYSLPQDRFKSPLSIISFTMVIILTFLSIFIYLRIILSNKTDIQKKNQAKLILSGIGVAFFAFILINFVIQIIIIDFKIPDLTTLGLIITSIIIDYAMRRYELFSMDFTVASEKIFASISDYLILTDAEDKIISTNQQFLNLIGYKENELLGRYFNVLVSKDHITKLNAFCSKLSTHDLKSVSPMDIEIDLVTKSKEKKRISLTASKIFDKSGNFQGFIYICRDITKTYEELEETISNLKLTENKLKKSEKRYKEAFYRAEFYKDLFIHDINNIQQIILSSIQFIELKISSTEDSEIKKYLNIMRDQVNRVIELIENLRKISQIDEGRLLLKKQK